MRERVVVFGADSPLVGIVTEPDAGVAEGAPAFVFLNAGLDHRVGPNRSSVVLARKLADIGLVSLRFDFSGIGDSPVSRSVAEAEERAISEAIQAMDFLERSVGARAFVPVGLCSGANVGFDLASRDERIAGAVLINPAAIPAKHTADQVTEARRRAQSRHYASRVADWKSWMRVLTGRSNLIAVFRTVARFARRKLRAKESSVQTVDLGVLPELDRRGVEILSVYTDGDLGLELLLTHVGRIENLASLKRFRIETLSESDHLLTPLWAQRRLEEIVLEWATARISLGQQEPRRSDRLASRK